MNGGGLKQEFVTVPNEWGRRDAGKRYLITEWDAASAEKWAVRAYGALKGSTAYIPPEAEALGMVGIARIGINAFLRAPDIDIERVIVLMDQLLECVQIIRDPKHPEYASPLVSPDDIAEVRTRLWLRSEVLRVHTGFSIAEALSRLISAAMETPPETSSPT